MISQIEIRLKDNKTGEIKASFLAELPNEYDTRQTMERIIPWILNKGTIKALQMEMEFNLSGVPFQKGVG